MAHITADRVRQISTSTGTGTFVLSGSINGFRAFSSVLSVGDTFWYAIAAFPGTEWEVGLGTYSSANTITRTTVLASSNAGAAVAFSAGDKEVFITAAASKFLQADASGSYGNFTAGTITAALTGNASTATTLASDTAWMKDRGSVTLANQDTAISNGFYTQTNASDSQGILTFNPGGSLGPLQMTFTYGGLFQFRNKTDSNTWTAWKTVLHSSNYNSYSPTLTGTGASGSWGISVTGSAATFTSTSQNSQFNSIGVGVAASGTAGNATINNDLTVSGKITNVKNKINTVTGNLGSPTVEEMALFHGQYNNKFRFISAFAQEESTDGTTWTTSTRATANQLADIMLGEGQTGNYTAIPAPSIGGAGYYRLTWDQSQTGYVYLNALYIYCSTQGNTLTFTVERFHNTTGWETTTTGTANVWPGHVYIPHTLIPFSSSASQYGKVRVTFSFTSATTANAFLLYAVEWFGGYPAGKRNVESYDRLKNVTFPAGIITPSQFTSTVATGTAPLAVTSTTLVTNLNADRVDGYQAAEASTVSTVAARNASGDINVRLIREEFADQATISGGMVFRVNNSTDNYLRVCNDVAAIRTYLGAYASSNPSGYTTNTGTVTSVGGTGTVSGLTLTGTVTTTGNLTLGGTLAVTASNFASQTANTFLSAPNGTAGVPTFRAIVAADVPTLNQNTTGSAATFTSTTQNSQFNSIGVGVAASTTAGSITAPKFDIRRDTNLASGIRWYSNTYTAWQTYMSNAVASSGAGGNITAPSGTLVTSWALRNFIESVAGYGWTWESGSSTSTTPVVVAELRSSDGSMKISGSMNSPFYESPQTISTNYTITAGNNAMTPGPITIASGVTVTVPSGSVWTIV